MDGQMFTMLGGFVATWTQIGIMYYKLGKVEQRVKDLWQNIKLFRGKR